MSTENRNVITTNQGEMVMSIIKEPLQPPITMTFHRTKTYIKELKVEGHSLAGSQALEVSCGGGGGGTPSFHTNTLKK